MTLQKRDWVYIALLAFVGGGSVIDSVYQTYLKPYTLNDFVQMVGIILLTSWWQIEDALLLEKTRSTAAKIVTVLIAPVGLAIYLFQSRSAGRAVLVLLAFVLGVLAAMIAGTLLGDQILLMRQGM